MRGDIAEAGAIAFREGPSGEIEYLLVTAKNNPTVWIFPKGHIERGETAEQGALRELREEGGVEGEVVRLVGSVRLQRPTQTNLLVTFFLVRATGTIESSEERASVWLRFALTLERLTFPESRDLLLKAVGES